MENIFNFSEKIKLITSQNLNSNNCGGIKSTCITFNEVFNNKLITPHKFNFLGIIKYIYGEKNNHYIIIGYSDLFVFLSIPLFFLYPDRITYIPCFHPWFSVRRKFLAWLYEIILLRFLLKANTIVCLSQWEKLYLKNINKKSNFITINHPPRKLFQTPSPSGKQKKLILFVGRDDQNKRLDYFIKIASELKSLNASYRFAAVSNTNRDLPDFIELHKNISDLELLSLYKIALAVIVTSKWESLSLVGVEAIFQGAKVAGFDSVKLLDNCDSYPTLMHKIENINQLFRFLETKNSSAEFKKFTNEFSFERLAAIKNYFA